MESVLSSESPSQPHAKPGGAGSTWRGEESNAVDAEMSGSAPQPALAESGEPADALLGHDEAESPSDATNMSTDSDAESRWGVMRHRHYRNVVAAQFVSNCGNWMEMVGLQMYVAQETGSLKWLGYLGAAQLTPILVLGTFGGLLADRIDRRRLLVVTQTLLMLAAAAVAAVAWIKWPAESKMVPIYLLVTLGAIQGVIMAFNMPAWQVLTPHLVPRAELTRAITVNGIQFNLSRVIGPAIAGLIMGTWGVVTLFGLNTLSFLVVVATVCFTPRNPPPPHDGKRAFVQIRDAASFLYFNKGPFAVFMATVVMSALAAPLVRFLSLFIIDVYKLDQDRSEHMMGWMLAVQGIGAVIGGVSLKYLPRWYPKHHLIPVAILGNGLFITLFAVSPTPELGFTFMLAIGFFWIWAFNQSWAALQHLAPDAMRGRVMALASVASFGSTAIGSFVGGYIGELLNGHMSKAHSTQASIASLSIILLGAGVVMLVKRTPEVDGMARMPRDQVKPGLLNAILAKEHRPRPNSAISVPRAEEPVGK